MTPQAPELLRFADELRKWWSFDDGQMHTHSWHSREDFIERELPKLLTRPTPAERPVPQVREDWIDQNYQIDRYGVALMMIREGCADPSGLARRILSEFEQSSEALYALPPDEPARVTPTVGGEAGTMTSEQTERAISTRAPSK